MGITEAIVSNAGKITETIVSNAGTITEVEIAFPGPQGPSGSGVSSPLSLTAGNAAETPLTINAHVGQAVPLLHTHGTGDVTIDGLGNVTADRQITSRSALAVATQSPTHTYFSVDNTGALFTEGQITCQSIEVVNGGNTPFAATASGDITGTSLDVGTGNITGNGSGITFLNASQLATGTIPTARLGSGSASSSTFLRGDSTWVTLPPTINPANPTGTIGLTAVNGTASTFLRSDGAPALSVAIVPTWTGLHTFNGGLVATTITGNGSAITNLTATNLSTGTVPTARLGTGTASSSTYLRGDQTWATVPPTVTSANPTGTIGLTAVNGSASTFMRSDAAPALSVSIVPTWTGLHTFTNGLNVTGGNVAIGTTTSIARLMITNTNDATHGIMFGYLGSDIQGRSGVGLTNNDSLTLNQYGGNVGICTASPAEPLDVKVATNEHIGFFDVSGVATLGAFDDGFYNWKPLRLAAGSTSGIITLTTSTGYVCLNPTGGNVGIGTASPIPRLAVYGPSFDPNLAHNAGATQSWGWSGGVQLALSMSNSSPYTVSLQTKSDAVDGVSYPIAINPLGGNVGIGTTGPLTPLHISGTNANSVGNVAPALLTLQTTTAAGADVGPGITFGGESGNGVTPYPFAHVLGVKGSVTAGDYTGNLVLRVYDSVGGYSEMMRITPNKIGIGTSSPAAALHVRNSLSAVVGTIVQGAVGQSADLIQLLNSSGSVMSSVGPAGFLDLASNGDVTTVYGGMSAGYYTGHYGWIQSWSSNPLWINKLGNHVLIGGSSGNLGVGSITTPIAKLHVVVPNGSYQGLFAGTSQALRINAGGGSINLDGTDPTGSASYQPIALGGSVIGLTINGSTAASVTSTIFEMAGQIRANLTGQGLVTLIPNSGLNYIQSGTYNGVASQDLKISGPSDTALNNFFVHATGTTLAGGLTLSTANTGGNGLTITNTSTGGHSFYVFSTGQINNPGQLGVYDVTDDKTNLTITSSKIWTRAAGQFGWSSEPNYSGASNPDTGLARSSAGVVKITDGSTGTGSLVVSGITASGPITATSFSGPTVNVNGIGGIPIASQMSVIDAKTVATTVLFTIPAGKTGTITGVEIWTLENPSPGVPATLSIGTPSSPSLFMPATQIPAGYQNAGDIWRPNVVTGQLTAGIQVAVTITTASTAGDYNYIGVACDLICRDTPIV